MALFYVTRATDLPSEGVSQDFTPLVEGDLSEQSIAESIRQYGGWRGGAHVLDEDGEVEFLSETSQPSNVTEPSYGPWGALGTRQAHRPEVS